MSALEKQRYLFKKQQKNTKSREVEVKSKLEDFRDLLKKSKAGVGQNWLKGKLQEKEPDEFNN